MERDKEKQPERKREEEEEITHDEVQFAYEQSGELSDFPLEETQKVRRP
ncbi:hypothetical protein [Desmospora profundinema]|uniref:Uncharacterized protein n=1 Tax=Desmospora profundinema TaxID=1571184 RepID=A0ABU1IRB0_9BACL|nr:hypothetical protein [Desmospora profundinema]MDR6227329.1 hypothetical protein [Desmospora profundinema]